MPIFRICSLLCLAMISADLWAQTISFKTKSGLRLEFATITDSKNTFRADSTGSVTNLTPGCYSISHVLAESHDFYIRSLRSDTTIYLKDNDPSLEGISISDNILRFSDKIKMPAPGGIHAFFSTSQPAWISITIPVKGRRVKIDRFELQLQGIKHDAFVQYCWYKRDTVGYWSAVLSDTSIQLKGGHLTIKNFNIGKLITNEVAISIFVPQAEFRENIPLTLKGKHQNSYVDFLTHNGTDYVALRTKSFGLKIDFGERHFVPAFKLNYLHD